MNIPQGYKQTELGVIPKDWNICKICEGIADVKSGKRLPLGFYVTENKTAHPYIRVIDMFDGGVDTSNIMYIPNEAYPAIKDYRIYKDDIFISVAGTLGIVGKIPESLDGANLTENANRLTKITCNRDYLLYFLRSPYIQNIIVSEQTIGAQPKLALTRIRNFDIILPSSIEEQQRIAEALSDVDKLIAALDKKIAKKKLIKQAAMQQLLTGKKRLQGFCEKWHTILLANNTIMNSGGTPLSSNPEYYDGDIPFLSISDITDAGKYINKTERCITEKGLNNSSAKMFVKGTIMYAMYASLGKCAISNISLACSQAILGIVPNNEIDSEYLYYYLCFIEDSVKELGQTGTQSNLSKQLVQNFAVFLPKSIKEQQAISKILSDMDEEIWNLERKRDKHQLLKSGMMQKLLTGQIRLTKSLADIIPLTPNVSREIPLQAHIIAGHIVNKLHNSYGFGRTKLQKAIHLIVYHCQLDLGNEFIRNTAGPDDQVLMNYIDGKFRQYNHVRIEKKMEYGKHQYTYTPTTMISEIEQVYETYHSYAREKIDALLDKIKLMDLARAEIVSTLYAVWNNRIIKGELITDELLLNDFYAWSAHKSDFSRDLVLRGLDYMRNVGLVPTGWGKYINKIVL